MRGGDIQRAFIRPGVLSGDRFYGIDFRQDFTSDTNLFLVLLALLCVRCLPLREKFECLARLPAF